MVSVEGQGMSSGQEDNVGSNESLDLVSSSIAPPEAENREFGQHPGKFQHFQGQYPQFPQHQGQFPQGQYQHPGQFQQIMPLLQISRN